MPDRVMTIQDACLVADIVRAAQAGDRVRWDDDDHLDIQEGVVRSIGNDSGAFLRPECDVRDAFLRITMLSGFERFMPMSDVMRLLSGHRMAFDKK